MMLARYQRHEAICNPPAEADAGLAVAAARKGLSHCTRGQPDGRERASRAPVKSDLNQVAIARDFS